MKKTKIKLLVAGILTTIITTSTPVFATTNSGTRTGETLINTQEIQTQITTDSGVKVNSNDNLSTKELFSIKKTSIVFYLQSMK